MYHKLFTQEKGIFLPYTFFCYFFYFALLQIPIFGIHQQDSDTEKIEEVMFSEWIKNSKSILFSQSKNLTEALKMNENQIAISKQLPKPVFIYQQEENQEKTVTPTVDSRIGKITQKSISSSVSKSKISQNTIKPQNVTQFLEPKISVVNTTVGRIQFGSPPEMAKKWMRNKNEVPTYYVLPPDPMFRENSINFGDIEFPIYWYAFVKNWVKKGKRITVIGTPDQIERMATILQETIFGPSREVLEKTDHPSEEIDRIVRECHHFAVKDPQGVPYPLEAFVNFVTFNQKNIAYLDEKQSVSIHTKGNDKFIVCDNGHETEVKFNVSLVQKRNDVCFPNKPLILPDFGATFVGTSSGFDPHGLTTSFIIWMNKRGLLVDPLAYIGSHLKSLGISPVDVPDVLLTHVHGDHDAGLIEYILLRHKVRLFTTRVIFESFLRKAKAITQQDFENMVEFVELKTQQKQLYDDGFFITIRNNFHSIPTIGFIIQSPFESPYRTLGYSGDNYYDPDSLDKLEKAGLLTSDRVKEIKGFIFNADIFDSDIIFHEAGIPPIHTPKECLVNKSKQRGDKKEPIILVHTRQPNENDKEGLTVARRREHFVFKDQHKIDFSKKSLTYVQQAFNIEDNFEKLKYIANLLPDKPENYQKGEIIVSQDEIGSSIYVILSGGVKVIKNGTVVAMLARGDYFGEQSSVLGIPRTATIQTESSVSVLRIPNLNLHDLFGQIDNITALAKKFGPFEPILSKVGIFKGLPIEIIRQIISKLECVNYNQEDIVIKQGESGNELFIIQDGEVQVESKTVKGKPIICKTLGLGEVFGEMALLGNKDISRVATIKVTSPKARFLRLNREQFTQLCNQYPVLAFQFKNLAIQRS